ncbi:leucine-rich alpha-2-glycoprotein-like [Polypterus senegalus]|uniref:leucine-rich alpha-2-glycoprotein-like n=1 Tax=Polypterus senegalus TaxID=55291 RepID=UPI0019663A2C|nr:leucine-rich alpha-2-glycoprotein-like [Polypterus senegalus]XP_039604840.1 leucine-rich alpha-2-glycoprotein-like [Polypterus senegalus]
MKKIFWKMAVVFAAWCCSTSFACPHNCTCHLNANFTAVVCSSLPIEEFPTDIPINTISLSIEFTNLSNIMSHHLRGMPKLKELHLSGNKIRFLPSGFLKDLPLLQSLDLTGNLLHDLPQDVFCCSALENLVLKGNQLLNVNSSLFHNLNNLTWLDLSDNHLESLPLTLLKDMQSLKSIDLSNNKMEKIPKGLLQFVPQLERLHLNNNKLSNMEAEIFNKMGNLTHLFLQENLLKKVPYDLLQNLKSLVSLDLSDNGLTSIPQGLFDKLERLGESEGLGLDLSNNPWNCDCSIKYMWQWLQNHKEKVFYLDKIRCDTPEPLKRRKVISLSEKEIIC